MDQFGWNAAEVTLPATLFFVFGALTSPPAGFVMDRFDTRRTIMVGLVGLGIGLWGLSQMSTLWQFTFFYVLIACALSLCGLVSNMLILSRWFGTTRGRAAGILLFASSVTGAILPAAVVAVVLESGWRSTLEYLALLVGIGLVFVILLVRSFPITAKTACTEPTRAPPVISLIAALRDSRFYKLAVATAAIWFCVISLVQHQPIFLTREAGLPYEDLPTVFLAFFGASAAGKLLSGALSDYADKILVLILSLGLLAIALGLLANISVDHPAMLISYGVLGGLGFSGAFTMIQLVFAQFYAGPTFGRILASLVFIDTLAGAAGTRVIGLIKESSGSYKGGFYMMIASLLAAALLLYSLRGSATNPRVQT